MNLPCHPYFKCTIVENSGYSNIPYILLDNETCLSMYTYVCVYVYMYTHTHIHTHTHTYI